MIVHVSMHVCVCVCACEYLHSWKWGAESLHLAVVPEVSAVIPLKGRQALAPTPENKRTSLTKISLH